MTRPFKTTLLILVLNEIEGMRVIMPQINRDWVDQILIIDGKSTDGTLEYAQEHGYECYVQDPPGPRQAYMRALPHIRGDVVITFSPDGNCIPDCIPPLLDKMEEGYDLVMVSRYTQHSKSADDTLLTAFGNWLFTGTINRLFGGHYTDAMGIFRAFKTSLIKELALDEGRWYRTPEWLFWTRISWEPIMSGRAAKRKLKITEIPGDEPARIGGVAKLQPFRWGAAYYFQFLRDFLFWK
jgi:glycosyltransferase involved in cell wall biosynthesis